MFFFTEEYDYFRHVTVTITIISIVVYPILYIASNNAGKYYAIKSEVTELNKLVETVIKFKNVDSFYIGYFDAENRINDILIHEDKNIFENFGVDKSYYCKILNDMNSMGIKILRKDQNVIFFKKENLPGLIYYINTKNRYINKQYSEYNIRIDENWYAYDY